MDNDIRYLLRIQINIIEIQDVQKKHVNIDEKLVFMAIGVSFLSLSVLRIWFLSDPYHFAGSDQIILNI